MTDIGQPAHQHSAASACTEHYIVFSFAAAKTNHHQFVLHQLHLWLVNTKCCQTITVLLPLYCLV